MSSHQRKGKHSRRKEYTLERFAQEARTITAVRFKPLRPNLPSQSFRYYIGLFNELHCAPEDFPYPLIIHDVKEHERLEILGIGIVHVRIKGSRRGPRWHISLFHEGHIEVSRLSRVLIKKPPNIIHISEWTELPIFTIWALIDPNKRLS